MSRASELIAEIEGRSNTQPVAKSRASELIAQIEGQKQTPQPSQRGVTGTWTPNLEGRLRENIPRVMNAADKLSSITTSPPFSTLKESISTAKEAAPNILPDVKNYMTNVASPLIPKKEDYYIPSVGQISSVGNLAAGGAEKLIPGEQPHEKYANAIGQWAKETHGSPEALHKYIVEHPVQAAAELSSILGLTGTIASKSGSMLNYPSVASTGKELTELGRAIEPMNVATNIAKKTITPIVKGIGKGAAQLHGRMMTGAGAEATKQAYEAHPEFANALRGNISQEDIINESKGALGKMRENAVAEYGEQFDKIAKMKKPIDITPVKEKIVKNLHDSLNVKFELIQDPSTGQVTRNVNYNNNPLPPHQLNNVKKIVDIVENWDDLTPKGVDYLKRQIDNYYIGTSDSRQYDRFVNTVRSSIKEQLVKTVPQYKSMTEKYAKFTDIEEEIGRALSLDDKAMVDTGLRKLMSTMRENFEWRKGLVQKLDEVSNGELLPKIAGYTMQSYMPKGLVGKLEMGTGAIITYLHGIDPILGTALAMSSPRLSGEFIYMLGKTAKALNKIPKGSTPIETGLKQGLFQMGRTQKEMESK